MLSRAVLPAGLGAAPERCQPGLQQFRGLAYVAGDRVAQLSAASAGADVTLPGVHVDLDQAGECQPATAGLGIGGLGPRLLSELFGGHAGEDGALDLQPVRVQRGRPPTIAANVVAM